MVAVLREIKERYPDTEIRFWCDRKFGRAARSIIGQFDPTIPVQTVTSGKLRRYHSLTFWQQLTNVTSIALPNAIDMVKVAIGFFESIGGLIAWRPDVVFSKGGFVCLPIGMAARVLNIPLVIHDSDAHPGLTSRILARWAVAIGTGAPLKFYPYPATKSKYVGVPVRADFAPFTAQQQAEAKQALGFTADRPLVVVTGGGLGAKRLNMAVASSLKTLLPRMNVILISGEGQYDDMNSLTPVNDERFQLHPFVSKGMAEMLGAADIVVARAGATTILELAALAKPTILVPNGFLTGGHQLKNAAVYAEKNAVRIVDELELEKTPSLLVDELFNLLADPARAHEMSKAFYAFAKPEAAAEMADMIVSAAGK